MLKGISPLIGPSLLVTLTRMGHGDEIVLADAHFPGESLNAKIIRADGLMINDLLSAIMPLFELDSYTDNPLVMMQAVDGDRLDPAVEEDYLTAIRPLNPRLKIPKRIGRQEFYERAKKAFAVVMTGETRQYGNIILIKGVTPNATNLGSPGPEANPL